MEVQAMFSRLLEDFCRRNDLDKLTVLKIILFSECNLSELYEWRDIHKLAQVEFNKLESMAQ